MMFGTAINLEILDLAKAAPDQEICGFIIDNKVVAAKNVHSEPGDNFEIKGSIPKGAQAIFHSHPGGPFYPSTTDMKQQHATALPWGIACTIDLHEEVFWFGDQVEIQPLVGRGFRHGVTDCYSLIRDFYRTQFDIELPLYPRQWEWWREGVDGPNFYETKLEEAGFTTQVSKHEQLLPGDIFLANIKSKVANHAGVILGNGLVLHHLASDEGYDITRLSLKEPVQRWAPFINKVVRHENSSIDRSVVQALWGDV